MSRAAAIASAQARFSSGAFEADLARAVAIPTESQNSSRAPELLRYLNEEVGPTLTALGFTTRILENTRARGPFLYAERLEDSTRPTVLGYGHGDVIRGLDGDWAEGLSPWKLTGRADRLYGRGVADNKGQHIINFAAQRADIETRGRLNFNAKWLIEMGEECGSPGLRELCNEHCSLFTADLLLASDGPRVSADRPTLFLGARGALIIDLTIEAREGGHHSGNWGGLISNPGIQLAHAIAAIVGPTGQIRVPAMVPTEPIPESIRRALADVEVGGGPEEPKIEPGWGEPGLTSAEKVFGWCSFEVLAFETGNPKNPVNAIPPRAWTRCQLRHVVGVEQDTVIPALRRHLERQGLGMVRIEPGPEEAFKATRLSLDHPWVGFAAASLQQSSNLRPALLPNHGGALPNDVFSDDLGLPTIWVPHSYPGCSQHAPDEHVPVALVRQALAVMAGLYWDLVEINDWPSRKWPAKSG